MAKARLTKGELKRQRDALKRFERYLPTLQLKKQQIQMEILHQLSLMDEKKHLEATKKRSVEVWAGLLAEEAVAIKPWLVPRHVATVSKNIAGVDIPQFVRADFDSAEYDLFSTPLWVDQAVEILRALVALRLEISTIEKGVVLLRHELRVTTQRVNLFEKVKIPETQEAIRLIKIYIGDQMTNAVGRSKIAKRKIEEAELEEAKLAEAAL
jgi:V/A-type H+-transporting ATPase subunit D